MKTLVWISRLLVGTIFILSGLVKANDPHGFSYKLQEYFDVFSKDLTTEVHYELTEEGKALEGQACAHLILENHKEKIETEIPESEQGFFTKTFVSLFSWFGEKSLGLAIFICVLEILLGLAVLYGFKVPLVSWLLLLMILFFTFLTFYSAYFEKVTDCGCFGDALKLTPWQSFGKDVFLLVFILPIFFSRKRIQSQGAPDQSHAALMIASVVLMALLCILQFKWYFPILFIGLAHSVRWLSGLWFSKQTATYTALITTVASAVFSIWTARTEPLKDYRPWAVGKNIRTEAASSPDRIQTNLLYIRKSDCEVIAKDANGTDWSWMTEEFDQTHLFWKQENKVLEEGQQAKIKDISMFDPYTGTSMGDSLFAEQGYALLSVVNYLDEIKPSVAEEIARIAAFAAEKGVFCMVAAPENDETLLEFRQQYQIQAPVVFNDEKALKTILRSNGGLVLLKNGIVMNKWSARTLPTVDELKAQLGA